METESGSSFNWMGALLVVLMVLMVLVVLGALLVLLVPSLRDRRRQRHQRTAHPPTVQATRQAAEALVSVPGRPHAPPPPPTGPGGGPDAVTLSAGRFTLLEELGRGGMGVVWRVRDNVLGRQVAIKQLLPPAGLSTEARGTTRARMLREARAAAQLDHRSAVTVHDVLVDQDSVLIVMELVKAVTLIGTVEREGPLVPARAAAIGLDMLDVLTGAHQLGIVHRDVKPANVLVRRDGSIKLADFGIARFAGDPTLTEAGAVIGTPAYMAPEQIRGLDSSPATDLWGLGATLYYAVEGKPAFGGPSPTAAMAAVLTDPPSPPRRAGSSLGPLLVGLLAKDPRDRPTSAALRPELARLAQRD